MRNLKPKMLYQLDLQEFNTLVEEVYGIPYDVQMGEYGQNTYIEENNIMGEPGNYEGYWKGLRGKPSMGILGYDNSEFGEDSEFVGLRSDEVIEYQKDHSPSSSDIYSSKDRPFGEVDKNGEYTWWQPGTTWILNDMVKRGEIPPGDYQILIWW